MAARIWLGWVKAFEPNAPPTYGEMIRSRPGSRAKALVRSATMLCGPWLASHRVSESPSHRAMVVCGSIGLLCSVGVS
jgi:hypothetical protein